MYVGVYRIELHVPGSQSLKMKRSVVQSLRTRLAQLGVSVAEVEGQDLWQRAVLGVGAVSSDARWLDDLADRIEAVCLKERRATLLRVSRDVRPVDL